MKTKSFLFGAVAAVIAAAPANAGPLDAVFGGLFDTDSAQDREVTGIQFSNALYDGYLALSDERDSNWDLLDAEHFNHKARTAARRSSVLPDEPDDRWLKDEDKPVFADALLRMRKAFDRGGRVVAPQLAAKAQVNYDCWIEATEAARSVQYQPSTRGGECKEAFDAAMNGLDALATFKLTDFQPYVSQAAAPAPQADSFLVYFNFDSTVATDAGRVSLESALVAAQTADSTTVRLVAHADRAGAVDYNQALSQRRLSVVMEAMARAGVDVGRIVPDAVGETQSLIPTEDGVREPGNRVVEIDLVQ
ncbi:OmpA family protein [Kiloniella laminariae]|uniref:OmpA family protein n=1 Tax=Kiloniella laminariae TaxID=454162 RepID=A0ABT4LHU1_9PROT|nr:OmpA family protein [Kiloniella laminariae]MCZ4280669.1 OmpA family protein [Kiloniella laminariae]